MAVYFTKDDLVAALGLTTAADLVVAQMVAPLAAAAVHNFLGFDPEYTAAFTEYLPADPQRSIHDPLVDAYDVIAGRVRPVGSREDPAGRVLQLNRIPVRGVAAVYEDVAAADNNPPTWSSETQLLEGADWFGDWELVPTGIGTNDGFCRTGHLLRQAGVWSRWPRAVKVTYACGFTPRELDGAVGRYKEFFSAALVQGIKMVNEFKFQAGRSGLLQQEAIGDWSQTFSQPQKLLLGLETDLCPAAIKFVENWKLMQRFI